MVINATAHDRNRLASAVENCSQKAFRKQDMKLNMKFTTKSKSHCFIYILILIN